MTAMSVGERPVVLVISPMPAFPASAGNRRRLVATCEFLEAAGFDIDFAYVAHEDQIYRRFNRHPPTDMAAMASRFRNLYLIEVAEPIRLRTGTNAFYLDDWCPEEVNAFVAAYFAASPGTQSILVNYVWLSRALESVPPGVLKLIDTHDRFADRKAQYIPFRAEANFFHTDVASEARGLARADLAIAIQAEEQAYFTSITGRPVALLLPVFRQERPFVAPKRLDSIGFLGHGNDANLMSISRFIEIWRQRWQPGWPLLKIAGEICKAFPENLGPGIVMMGYVDRIGDFFEAIDLMAAPILLGTGLKMKVVETLSHGVPVIGTDHAFHGIRTDVLEHRLNDLHAMVDRIGTLSHDEQGLAALTTASALVFERYQADARTAAAALADQINQHQFQANAGPSTGLASHPSSDANAVLVQPITIDAAGATLFATEFREFSASDPASLAPSRRQWWVSEEQETIAGQQDLASCRVSLAALMTSTPDTPVARALSRRAIEALAVAVPEWHSIAESLVVSSTELGIVFTGPSLLIKAVFPVRAFALDAAGHAHELTGIRIAAIARPGNRLPPPATITPRCGDALPLALTLLGSWTDAAPQRPIASVMLITNALLGRLNAPPAADTGEVLP